MGFQSPCLIWLVKAFVRRWKFLTHHTKKSSRERSLRGSPPGGESLIVDIDTAERRPTRVRFRAWGDGRIQTPFWRLRPSELYANRGNGETDEPDHAFQRTGTVELRSGVTI